MAFRLVLATASDAAEIAALQCAANHVTSGVTAKGVALHMRRGKVYVVRRRGKIIATLCLTSRKPWAIDTSYFAPVRAPLYLIAMAVVPECQRKGVGRKCLAAADELARDWPADAIRLDAYDRATGAGGFYHRCGYREVGRATYRKTPLIYYERLLPN